MNIPVNATLASNDTFPSAVPVTNAVSMLEAAPGYLENKKLFYCLFLKIPCCKSLSYIDGKKGRQWAEKELKSEIVNCFYTQSYDKYDKKMGYDHYFLVLKSEILIEVAVFEVSVLFSNENAKAAQELIDQFKKFIKRRKKQPRLHMVINTNRGLDTTSLALKKPVIDFAVHYNEDLLPFHTNILEQLKQEDRSGLFLFHGKPGTGKSTYIRFLVQQTNKKIIFISPKMAGNLDGPAFTLFLIQNERSILVIEDAEELVVSREMGFNSNISMLLNLTDGLLGEALGIKVIATFNTQVSNLDTALLRKGRLKGLYEFKELSADRSKLLLGKLGNHDIPVSNPMTLADIFNIKAEQMKYGTERKKIGFVVS